MLMQFVLILEILPGFPVNFCNLLVSYFEVRSTVYAVWMCVCSISGGATTNKTDALKKGSTTNSDGVLYFIR